MIAKNDTIFASSASIRKSTSWTLRPPRLAAYPFGRPKPPLRQFYGLNNRRFQFSGFLLSRRTDGLGTLGSVKQKLAEWGGALPGYGRPTGLIVN